MPILAIRPTKIKNLSTLVIDSLLNQKIKKYECPNSLMEFIL